MRVISLVSQGRFCFFQLHFFSKSLPHILSKIKLPLYGHLLMLDISCFQSGSGLAQNGVFKTQPDLKALRVCNISDYSSSIFFLNSVCGRLKRTTQSSAAFLHGRLKTRWPAVGTMSHHPNGRWNTAHEKGSRDKGDEKLHI